VSSGADIHEATGGNTGTSSAPVRSPSAETSHPGSSRGNWAAMSVKPIRPLAR
jgi:hypothetical protein